MRKIHHAISTLICTAALTLSAISVLHAEETPAKPDVTAKVETKDGLETVAFDTINGVVEVNLPDDMAATDTISGTVVTEPKSEKKDEIASNQDELNGYVVEVVKTKEIKEPVAQQGVTPGPPIVSEDCPHVKPKANVPSGFTCGIAPAAATVIIALINPAGEVVCQKEVPCKAKPPAKPTTCIFPPQGTCDKPLQIKGPCDGRSANSTIKIKGTTCPVLAESPRQQICKPPKGCVGTGQIERTEAGKITRGTITMHPALGLTQVFKASTTAPKTSHKTGKIWKRTGPVVEQTKTAGQGRPGQIAADIAENQVSWTRSVFNNRMAQNNLTFTPPPAQLAAGESFDMTLSLSGDPECAPQASCFSDGSLIRSESPPASCILSSETGHVIPTITQHFKLYDPDVMIADYLRTHPGVAMKASDIQAAKTRPGNLIVFTNGLTPAGPGVQVKITWSYVLQ